MIRRLLVIRFSALGDVAMTVPVVYGIARSNPDTEIFVLSRGFCEPLFSRLPSNVRFIGADLKNRHAGIRGLGQLYRELLPYGFDAVADLHDVLRSKYLRYRFMLHGVKTMHIDKGRRDKQALVKKGYAASRPLKPTFSRYADVFLKSGLEYNEGFVSLYGKGPAVLEGRLLEVAGQKAEGGRWLGIAPFAAHEGKQLPIASLREVIGILLKKYGDNLKIFYFGSGAEECRIIGEMEKEFPGTVSVAGKFKLAEELALMSNLDVMVSMDSANMHLASLVNVPVVSVWGATHHYAGFLGWRQSKENIVESGLECRPCSIYGNRPCSRDVPYECMKTLTGSLVDKILLSLK